MKFVFATLCLLMSGSQSYGEEEKFLGPLTSVIDKLAYWNEWLNNFLQPQPPVKPTVYCYWGSWTNTRPGIGAFGVSDLPTNLCTHIIYSFAVVSAEGVPYIYDSEGVVNGKSNTIEDALALISETPDVKFHISIGGWSAGSDNFTIVVNNDTLRANFVKNVYDFVIEHGFHGVDVDWEYPSTRGGAETDKEAFIWLLRDLQAALKPAGLSLTIAVGVSESLINTSYDVPAIMKYVDLVVLMTYDYHGSWNTDTGVNAPLYKQETDNTSDLNVNASVTLWIENGAIPSKLLLGIGSYGKTFTLASTDNVGTGANITGLGNAGPYSEESGILTYYEICLAQLEETWNVTEVSGNYVYANNGLQWVGYDNESTMRAKGAYARSKGLNGVALWSVDNDDFSAQCSSTKYPILSAAIAGYNNAIDSF